MQKNGSSFKTGSASLLFLTGMGAGVAAAVLLAPRSGAATRRLIGRKVENGEEWMRDRAASAQEYVSNRREKFGGRIKQMAGVIGLN